LLSRIGLILLLLPILYWATFHIQGFFFDIFTDEAFLPVGLKHLVKLDVKDDDRYLVYPLVAAGILFVLSLAFTGAAMFTKQPLVKSLFAIAVIVMLFVGYSYIVIEHIGLGYYQPPEQMLLVPLTEKGALQFVTVALSVGTVVMLIVAFRKLKEREV